MIDDFEREEIREIEEVFLSLEKEYVGELLANPKFQELLNKYFMLSTDDLFREFKKNCDQMENGEITEKEEWGCELKMIACALAANQMVKKLIKKRYYYDEEDYEQEHGRSR